MSAVVHFSSAMITAASRNLCKSVIASLWKYTPVMTASTQSGTAPPIESAIREALTDKLKPLHLEVINESYMHNAPRGSESHFKVVVVSDQFQDLSLLKCHRLVNNIVKDRLAEDFVHALSIETKTPKQWDPSYKTDKSPNCLGGFGK